MTKYVEDATDVDGHPVKVLTREREAIHDAIVTDIIKGVKPRSGTRTTIFHRRRHRCGQEHGDQDHAELPGGAGTA